MLNRVRIKIKKVSFHVNFDFAQSDELENNAELSQVFKIMFSSNNFINAFHIVDTSQFFKLIKKNEKILTNVIKKAVNKTFKNARKKTKIEKKTVTYETVIIKSTRWINEIYKSDMTMWYSKQT